MDEIGIKVEGWLWWLPDFRMEICWGDAPGLFQEAIGYIVNGASNRQDNKTCNFAVLELIENEWFLTSMSRL